MPWFDKVHLPNAKFKSYQTSAISFDGTTKLNKCMFKWPLESKSLLKARLALRQNVFHPKAKKYR